MFFVSFQQVVSDSMMAELKECFMEAYDDNKDGKIEIREVRILPRLLLCLTSSRQSRRNLAKAGPRESRQDGIPNESHKIALSKCNLWNNCFEFDESSVFRASAGHRSPNPESRKPRKNRNLKKTQNCFSEMSLRR